jgi:hypothetical protein
LAMSLTMRSRSQLSCGSKLTNTLLFREFTKKCAAVQKCTAAFTFYCHISKYCLVCQVTSTAPKRTLRRVSTGVECQS